jgi:predicted restriction endonuclease
VTEREWANRDPDDSANMQFDFWNDHERLSSRLLRSSNQNTLQEVISVSRLSQTILEYRNSAKTDVRRTNVSVQAPRKTTLRKGLTLDTEMSQRLAHDETTSDANAATTATTATVTLSK